LDIDLSDLVIDNVFPGFRCEFTRNPLDSDYELRGKYFKYASKYLDSFCFCNRRLFLHRLAKQLGDEGFVDIWCPQDQINNTLHKFHRVKWQLYKISSQIFSEAVPYSPWAMRILLNNGVDFDKSKWTASNIYRALDSLYRRRVTITRSSTIITLKHLGYIFFEYGYILSFVAMLREYFPNSKICNHTGLKWIDASSIVNNVVNGGDNVVNVVNKIPKHGNNIIYLGEMDDHLNITLRNGLAPELNLTVIR
jgi:hypothetical protein